MIPLTQKIGTQTIGATAKTMQIQANAYSFRMLTDNLYTDKLQSVMRELISNAIDATIAAGENFPVSVKFDGHTLHVRDFGVGMSHEFMEEVYTTMFSSTKREDNNQTGYIGIGSKSPFALVNAYTVKCYSEDDCRTYSVFLNDAGIPQLALVATEIGEFTTGVEVIVTIPDEYRYDINNKVNIMRLATYGKPVVYKGVSPMQAIPTEIAPGFVLYHSPTSSSDTYYSRSSLKVYVRQGSAVYPISASVDSHLLRALRPSAIVIDVPIGSFSVTPSREALSLTPDDHNRLRLLTDDASRHISNYVANEIAAVTNGVTDLDEVAQALATKFSVRLDTGYEFAVSLTSMKHLWEARDIGITLHNGTGSAVVDLRQLYKVARTHEVPAGKTLRDITVDAEALDKDTAMTPYTYYGARSESSQVTIGPDYVVVFIKKGVKYRKERLELWASQHTQHSNKRHVYIHGDDADAALLKSVLPFSKHIVIVPTSEIPVVKKDRTARPKTMTTYFIFNGTRVEERYDNISVEDQDMYLTTVIGNRVLFDFDNPTNPVRDLSRGVLSEKLGYLARAGLMPENTRIVLVPKSDTKSVADVTPFLVHAADKLEELLTRSPMTRPFQLKAPASYKVTGYQRERFYSMYAHNDAVMGWLKQEHPVLFTIGVLMHMDMYMRKALTMFREMHEFSQSARFKWRTDEKYIAIADKYVDKAVSQIPLFMFANDDALKHLSVAQMAEYISERFTDPTPDELNYIVEVNKHLEKAV